MSFSVGDLLVHPQHGVGRVVKLKRRQFGAEESRVYYEISMPKGTVWVPVDGASSGLRRLTPKSELAQYRGLLRGRPKALAKDYKQRQIDLAERLREGSFRACCEVLRDLSAHRWNKPLTESGALIFRTAHEKVYEEWAASDGITPAEAAQEIEALLLEAREAYKE